MTLFAHSILNITGLVQLQALQLSNRVRTLANRFLLESHSLRSAAATSSFDISASVGFHFNDVLFALSMCKI